MLCYENAYLFTEEPLRVSLDFFSDVHSNTFKTYVRVRKYEAKFLLNETTRRPRIGVEQYNTIRYDTIRYDTIQYNTIQYNTIKYDTIRYNTIHTPLRVTKPSHRKIVRDHMSWFYQLHDDLRNQPSKGCNLPYG